MKWNFNDVLMATQRRCVHWAIDIINSIDEFSIALLKEFSIFGFTNKRTLTMLFKIRFLKTSN